MTSTRIRPALTLLNDLPTLQAVSESVGRLELKLETETNRYWVTTAGVPRRTERTPCKALPALPCPASDRR